MPLDRKFPSLVPSMNIGGEFAIPQENECNVVNVASASKVNRKYCDNTDLVTASGLVHPSLLALGLGSSQDRYSVLPPAARNRRSNASTERLVTPRRFGVGAFPNEAPP